MTHLKQVMEQKRLHIPRDRELIVEMNAEIAQLTQAGKTKVYHRSGTHDDRLWALALAVYGSRHEIPSYHPFATFGQVVPSRIEYLARNRLGLGSTRPIPVATTKRTRRILIQAPSPGRLLSRSRLGAVDL